MEFPSRSEQSTSSARRDSKKGSTGTAPERLRVCAVPGYGALYMCAVECAVLRMRAGIVCERVE